MLTFLQCLKCQTFLCSSDSTSRKNHENKKCKSGTDTTGNGGEWVADHFRPATFPDLLISLERTIPQKSSTKTDTMKLRREQRKRRLKDFDHDKFSEFEVTDHDFNTAENTDYDSNENDEDYDYDDKNGRVMRSCPKSKQNKDRWKHDPNFINKYKYGCDKCSAKFYSSTERDLHIPIHTNLNRKLISCLVCQRIFNKRDSLNSHIAAHETAEAKHENLNLLENWPKIPYSPKSPYTRTRYACKYCLLICTNHTSFVDHFRSEHAGGKEKLPCRMDQGRCFQQFILISDLIKHAKTTHPETFYGKLTWNKMNLGKPKRGASSASRKRKRPNKVKQKDRTRTTDDDDSYDLLGEGNKSCTTEAVPEHIIKLEAIECEAISNCEIDVTDTTSFSNCPDVQIKQEIEFESNYSSVEEPPCLLRLDSNCSQEMSGVTVKQEKEF